MPRYGYWRCIFYDTYYLVLLAALDYIFISGFSCGRRVTSFRFASTDDRVDDEGFALLLER